MYHMMPDGSPEKRQYNIWREKYKTAQRTLKKQIDNKENPRYREFTLKEANQMAEGKFHDEDDEDQDFVIDADEEALKDAADNKANRAIYINRQNLKNEMKLD